MLLSVSICIISVTRVVCLSLEDSYKIELNNSHDEAVLNNFEIVKREKITIMNKRKNRFSRLNRIASKEYSKHKETSFNWIVDKERVFDLIATRSRAHVTPLVTKHKVVHKRNRKKEYDYRILLKEYYDQELESAKSNWTYVAKKASDTEIGILEALKLVEIKEVPKGAKIHSRILCVLNKCANKTVTPGEAAKDIWGLVCVWIYVYLIVAIPLFCAKGWCCPCLYCKIFKPRKTIENAKKYLLLNPPGVYYAKGKETSYEPTEEEKELYDIFEHKIRTI